MCTCSIHLSWYSLNVSIRHGLIVASWRAVDCQQVRFLYSFCASTDSNHNRKQRLSAADLYTAYPTLSFNTTYFSWPYLPPHKDWNTDHHPIPWIKPKPVLQSLCQRHLWSLHSLLSTAPSKNILLVYPRTRSISNSSSFVVIQRLHHKPSMNFFSMKRLNRCSVDPYRKYSEHFEWLQQGYWSTRCI